MDLLRDPFGDISEIRDRINRIFEETLGQRAAPAETPEARPWAPRVDIWETSDSLRFAVELPGVNRDDIEIEVDGDRMTIRGERNSPQDREFLRVERPYGPFHRSFAIGVPVDHTAAAAHYRDGVLEIVLPKAKHAGRQRAKVPIE